eukprot:SAG31_NODE_43641_length_266_cov_0.622754_1_plen_43_part_10
MALQAGQHMGPLHGCTVEPGWLSHRCSAKVLEQPSRVRHHGDS